MPELTVVIPGKIDRRLSPNARVHWRTLAKVKKETKEIASLYARQAVQGIDPTGAEHATYSIELGLAKGEQHKDRDNIPTMAKYQADCVAAELGVDDRGWSLGTVTQVRDPEGVGFLRITLEWDDAETEAA
jgi:hypothetical protein